MNKDWLDIEVLEAYLDGKLDAKTMNRVEREALEDPFVAEALAGLSESPKRSLQSISLLQKQLHKRIAAHQSVKKTSVFTWQRLSIAAAAAVMFIAVSVMFWMREDNRQKELADRSKKVDVTIAPKTPALDERSATVITAEPVLVGETGDKVKKINKAIKGAGTSASTAISANKAAEPSNVLSGKVVAHDDGKPLAGVSVTIDNTNLAAATDVNGEFKIKADTLINAQTIHADYIGFKPVETLAKVNRPVSIVLKPDAQLNETLVVGYGAVRKKGKAADSNRLNAAVAGKVARIQIRGLSPAVRKPATMASNPVGGWDKLFEYIDSNNAFAKEEKAGQVVELSFRIDRKGRPADIEIVNGADDKYEQEAIRLIANGPKWEKPMSPKNRMTFKINF